MKKYNEYINEGLLSAMKPKSDDDITKSLEKLSTLEKINTVSKYKLGNEYYPSKEEVIKELGEKSYELLNFHLTTSTTTLDTYIYLGTGVATLILEIEYGGNVIYVTIEDNKFTLSFYEDDDGMTTDVYVKKNEWSVIYNGIYKLCNQFDEEEIEYHEKEIKETKERLVGLERRLKILLNNKSKK